MSEFYDPRDSETYIRKFFFDYFPYSKYLCIIIAHLILIVALIPISITEYEKILKLPPLTYYTENNFWDFPRINFCFGKPLPPINIEHSYNSNCTLGSYNNTLNLNQYKCNVNQYYNITDKIFGKNFEDICLDIDVRNIARTDSKCDTSLITNFIIEQNFKLPKVQNRENLSKWMLEVPTEIMLSLNHRFVTGNLSSINFQKSPVTIKQTILILEEIINNNIKNDIKNKDFILNLLVSKKKYDFDYKIFTGQVGKYEIGSSICFDWNSTHNECLTHFETEIKIQAKSLDSSPLNTKTLEGKTTILGLFNIDNYLITFLTLIAGKFIMGRSIILLIIFLIEFIILGYYTCKKEDRNKNIDLYSRLRILQKKPTKLDIELKNMKESLLEQNIDIIE